MYSVWHNSILGAYDLEGRWIGLDYTNLLKDNLTVQLTIFHEQTHYFLCRDTDFGQAVESIYQFMPFFKHITKEEKEEIKKALSRNQKLVQEGTASLMEFLHLKRVKNKKAALEWAKKSMPDEYFQRLEKLMFVADLSSRYGDFFTMKIPFTSLHLDLRKKIVALDLLSKPSDFIEFLEETNNNPDKRFEALIEVIRYKDYLVTKPENIICEASKIEFYPNNTKEEVAKFLTYLSSLTENPRKFEPTEVKDPRTAGETLLMSFDDMVIANMNVNLGGSDLLNTMEDLLHYEKEIKAIMVVTFDIEDDWNKGLSSITGRKHEVGLTALLETGERLGIGMTFRQASELTKNQFADKTLMVKWGLYKPGLTSLIYFPNSRIPDVVIYNSFIQINKNFEEYFASRKTASFIRIGYKNHPFQMLVIKDENGVLHIVNTFGDRGVSKFTQDHRDLLKNEDPKFFLSKNDAFNHTMSFWNGLPWGVDWYRLFIEDLEESKAL